MYLNTKLPFCKTILQDDQNFYITNGTNLVPNYVLIDKLCPNNCSSHGVCSQGKNKFYKRIGINFFILLIQGLCNCENGFASADCSINLAIPPSIKTTSFKNNTCDLSKVFTRNIYVKFEFEFEFCKIITKTFTGLKSRSENINGSIQLKY